MRFLLIIISITFSPLFTGCEHYVNHHGFNPEQINISHLKINKDTTNTVLEKFGSPLIIAKFPEAKTGYTRWSYPYQRKESVSFLKSKVTNFNVLTLSFDKNGTLRKINEEKGDNINRIKIDAGKTVSQGYESSALKDTFGTFGKYGNMESGTKSPGR